jgi:hypothetical protein
METQTPITEKIMLEGRRVPPTKRCHGCGKKIDSLDYDDFCNCKFELEDLPRFKESMAYKKKMSQYNESLRQIGLARYLKKNQGKR